MTNKPNTNVKFLAIDQFVESNIVAPTEVNVKDRSFISWGEMNNYPDYIEDLYQNVSTLHSIIDGTTDYVCGNGIKVNVTNFETQINRRGETMEDLVSWIAKDLVKYNGFALNIVKNHLGTPAEIYYLDFRKVRSNKEGTKFYYSSDWGKSFGRVKYTEYDSFCSEEGKDKPSTIFYYKNDILCNLACICHKFGTSRSTVFPRIVVEDFYAISISAFYRVSRMRCFRFRL